MMSTLKFTKGSSGFVALSCCGGQLQQTAIADATYRHVGVLQPPKRHHGWFMRSAGIPHAAFVPEPSTAAAIVPEPSTALLFGFGIAVAGMARRRSPRIVS